MNRTVSNVLIFVAGVAVGSVATWKVFKSKYEIVDEGFGEEVIDDTEDMPEDEDEPRPNNENAEDIAKVKANLNKKPPLNEYVNMVNRMGYAVTEVSEEEEKDVYDPYIIRPEEYGEIHAYDQLSLNYYADGVLTDELDNRIEDVESIVPADFADHFGEYEEHAVHVRNDELKCDYEILRDLRTFAEVVGDDLYPSEDE